MPVWYLSSLTALSSSSRNSLWAKRIVLKWGLKHCSTATCFCFNCYGVKWQNYFLKGKNHMILWITGTRRKHFTIKKINWKKNTLASLLQHKNYREKSRKYFLNSLWAFLIASLIVPFHLIFSNTGIYYSFYIYIYSLIFCFIFYSVHILF